MSWISQNYEKAAIGGGLVVAAGLAFLGWSKVNGVDQDFPSTNGGANNSNVSVQGAEQIPEALTSLARKREWSQGESDSRPVDLFTGIPLFVKRDAAGKTVDLRTDAPVHPPIANNWWIENRLDPGFADSPARDPDQDGFTNLEEYESKTNPNDPKSHPELVVKLKYQGDESLQWLLKPGFPDGPGFTFKYFDNAKQDNRTAADAVPKPGDLFFVTGAMKNRFKYLGAEERQEENPNTHATETKTYVKVEDQRPNKKGKVYEIPNSIPDAKVPNYYQYDRTALLSLEAIGESGKQFKIEENTRFALPSNNPKKEYLLKKVTPEAIEVEYTGADGKTQTTEIRKSS